MSRALGLVAIGLALGSCGPTSEAGAWGRARIVGRVAGSAPLEVLPPVSDRNGNVYTLYGATDLPQVSAFVSRVAGGSAEVCNLTKGDVFGAHGWVGFADDRAWYWSGSWLVAVSPTDPCTAVLATDPHTNVELRFRAVIPWVRVTSSRRSLVAIIDSPGDDVPYSAMIDLDRNVATNVSRLPISADEVAILGVGADPDNEAGVVWVAAKQGTTTEMHALFFDEDARLLASAPVQGEAPPEYGVLGELQFGSSGTVVGLTSVGSLVAFDRSGGGTAALDGSMKAIGVHRWQDALWLVGTQDEKPVVRPIDGRGRPGAAVEWAASESAAAALQRPLDIVDDRSYPLRPTAWPTVRNGIGPFPFASPHSPWPHAPDTTLWVIAGPELDANGKPTTMIAIAPVGIRYP